MKIAVIGVGGVGGYYGGMMAKAGEDVTFVARGEQFTALSKHGLSVKSVDDEFHLPSISVVEHVPDLKNPDVIFLTTKTYDRDAVAAQINQISGPQTIIIPLLNGIDNETQLKKIISKGQVFPGLTYIISARTKPGCIEQTGGPRTILFGDQNDSENARLKEIESMMRAANIAATASPHILTDVWEKFIWLTAFAGVTSLCRSAIGSIVNNPTMWNIFIQCIDEGIAVATAQQVSLSTSFRDTAIKKCENYKHTAMDSKSSMLVDILNHRQTEIESLNGTMVKRGAALGVPTPMHSIIYNAVKLGTEIAAA